MLAHVKNKKQKEQRYITLKDLERVVVASEKRIEKRIYKVVHQVVDGSQGELAIIVNRSLTDLETRLTKRIDSIDAKTDSLREEMISKFDGVNRRLDDMADTKVSHQAHEKLTERVSRLEDHIYKKQ